jgi:hypothetical protein
MIDLNPFARTGHTTRLKWHHVISRELQLGRCGNRQAQTYAFAADAGKHLVADEICIQAIYFSAARAGKFQQQGVNLCLAGNFIIGIQGKLGAPKKKKSINPVSSIRKRINPLAFRKDIPIIRGIIGLIPAMAANAGKTSGSAG